jgi:adenylate cyclase
MDPTVRRLMREAELAAERTLARVRVVVPLILAAFVAVTVVPFGPWDDPLFRRQMALAAATITGYLLIGLVSLRTAALVPDRPWLAWTFATLDAGLMLASVAVTALNAGLPTTFAAGFPNIWIAPVILALALLRYDPRLQAWLTALVVGGLAAAAMLPTPAPGPAAPALGFFFELPPNLVRLAMLALAGGVLVVAALRARRLLERGVDAARRRESLRRFLPQPIADRLETLGADGLRTGARQRVAVLFADIRGFTAMAETMPPALVSSLVSAFRGRVLDAAERHGGVVDKFVGDCAMVVFGVPEPAADDAARALACARAVAAALDAWTAERSAAGEPPVAVGIGVHIGEAFCGAVGDARRLEFTVLGDTVNVAARLEALTREEPWRLIVSADLLAAAGEGTAGWTALAPRQLRGRAAPVALYASLPAPVAASAASASPSAR